MRERGSALNILHGGCKSFFPAFPARFPLRCGSREEGMFFLLCGWTDVFVWKCQKVADKVSTVGGWKTTARTRHTHPTRNLQFWASGLARFQVCPPPFGTCHRLSFADFQLQEKLKGVEAREGDGEEGHGPEFSPCWDKTFFLFFLLISVHYGCWAGRKLKQRERSSERNASAAVLRSQTPSVRVVSGGFDIGRSK